MKFQITVAAVDGSWGYAMNKLIGSDPQDPIKVDPTYTDAGFDTKQEAKVRAEMKAKELADAETYVIEV